MASEKITVYKFVCDGCGRTKLSEIEDEVPFGYHGSVMQHDADGGRGGKFYACCKTCIKAAVAKAAAGDNKQSEVPRVGAD